MSDQQSQQNQQNQQPLDTVSTAIVERWAIDRNPRQTFTSTTVQYLLRWSQVSLTQRATATLIDPTAGRRGICTPVVPNGPQHIALLPILEWSQAQSPECNTTTQILTAYQSGALAAVFHLPEGQSDQSTIRRTTLANLPIPVLLLTDQAYSIELAKYVTAANLSLSSDFSGAPNRVLLTLNPRAEVGLSTSSTWSIVSTTVGVALGAVVLTSLLMHVQLWRMRRARARKAFVRAVHEVEGRVLAHRQQGDDDDEEGVEDHLLSKAMLDDLPIKSYTSSSVRVRPTSSKRSSLASGSSTPHHRDSRRFSVYSLLSRLDHTPLAAAPEAKAARDRRVQSWLVPHDQNEPHLLPLSPRMRTSIVSRTSLDSSGAGDDANPKAMVKDNLSPNKRARSPLATDRVPRDPPATPKRARPVSFHPDTCGGNDDDSDEFIVPPMSPGMPSPPSSPTVGHRPALNPPTLKPFAQRGSWASLDANPNPRAKVADNLGEGKRAPRPLSMLNPASAASAAGAATLRKSSETTKRQSRPVSVIHTLFPLLPGSPYLHAVTDPSLPCTSASGAGARAAANDSCPICVDALVDGDQVRELPCAHVFHVACVDAWLTEEVGECPLCKFDVRGWWEREMGDGEDEGTEESEEDEEEQEQEIEKRKGGWFARAFGPNKKGQVERDEERALEPVPKPRKMKSVNKDHKEQPESAAAAPATELSTVAAEPAPAPAKLDATPIDQEESVADMTAAAAADVEEQAAPASK